MAASTRSIHSRQRAAGGRSRSSTSRGSSPSRRRRRAAALIGRTAGTSAARKIRARRRARRAGRTAGGRRGRSSARGGRLRRARRNLGRARGRRFSGPVSSGVWARRRSECSSGGQDRRRGRGRRRRRARSRLRRRLARLGRPALAVGRRPASRRVGSRIFAAISGTGRGQRSRMAMTLSNTQSAKISACGRWGVREGGERQGGGLGGRRNRIALPCASLQARCEAVRVHGQVQPRRRVARSGLGRGWAAGRRHRARATGGSPRARAGRRRRSGGRAARLRRR